MEFLEEAAHKAAHSEPLPNNQAPPADAIEQIIQWWPKLPPIAKKRLYNLAKAEACCIVKNATRKQKRPMRGTSLGVK